MDYAVKLHQKGYSTIEVAAELGISYDDAAGIFIEAERKGKI